MPMLQKNIDKLRTWSVGSRVRVTDDLGSNGPFFATILFIEDGFTGFQLKYDHSDVPRRLAVSDIHHFDLLQPG